MNSLRNPISTLQAMLLSRECDRREGILTRQGKAKFHLSSSGHEGLAVFGDLIAPGDLIFPHYRDRALVISLGVTIDAVARSFFGAGSSASLGRQLPSHFTDRALGIWSALSPVAHNLLPAAGAAWALARRGGQNISLALVGEASCRQGEFHEAVCFAAEKRLPVVFVVEDNHLGISTPTDESNPLAIGVLNPELVTRVDGRDPLALLDAADLAVRRARQGDGPSIIWCDLDRLDSHSNFDDQRTYLTGDDIAAKKRRDPVELFAQSLVETGVLKLAELEQRQDAIALQVRNAYDLAAQAPGPSAVQGLSDQLGSAPDFPPTPQQGRLEPHGATTTMGQAVNNSLRSALSNSRDVLLFGQDIEDPKGGVFRLTAGLSMAFPDQVFNSPLAEATLAGVAAGLASAGARPIVELQFIDFAGPSWSQIANNLTTLRWRSGGSWTCPVVIYAPYGGYFAGGGLWHSQAGEAAFCQLPGLRVVIPSRPSDVAGLFESALLADDPTLILVPKSLLNVPEADWGDNGAVPFGKAAMRREGSDVTVVAWGNTVRLAEAADDLLGSSASLEIIDLRSLMPWDRDLVSRSLRKTGRLLVVQEDNVSCSAGQMIISELCEDRSDWAALKAPPRLLGRPGVHIGFHPIYGESYLPHPSDVAEAVVQMIVAGE